MLDTPSVREKGFALLCGWLLAAASAVSFAAEPALTPQDVRLSPDRYVVLTVANPQAARAGAVGGTAHGYGGAGAYRVGATAAALVKSLSRDYALTPVSEWPIEQLQMHCIVFKIADGATRDDVLQRLRADKRVLIAQPLAEFTPATRPFDDPYVDLQANVRALDVADAHLLSRGQGVRVAVIDTGVDTEHPDLAGRVELVRNYVDKDATALRNDRHGTQVAGLIAAVANNGIGIVGVAPEVKLLALKACWQDSAASAGRCNSFTLAQALAGAMTERAQIINLSLVGPRDPLLTALLEKAIAAGVIVVGAAGEGDAPQGFPAALERVLAVAEAEESSGNARLLRAPGRDIVTLVPQGHYDFASGCSLSTAQVSGVVALLLQRNRRLRFDEVQNILQQSTDQVRTAQGSITSVNACTALSHVVAGASCNSN